MSRDYLPPGAPPPTAPEPAHEPTDVNVRLVVRFAAGLVVSLLLVAGLMAWVFLATDRFLGVEVGSATPAGRGRDVRLPPPPRLPNAMGQRYRIEEFTSDPILQAEIGRTAELNFERTRPEHLGVFYRWVKRRELQSYGIASTGEIRVPIEHAKALLLAREDPLAPVAPGALGLVRTPEPRPPAPPRATGPTEDPRFTEEPGRDRPEIAVPRGPSHRTRSPRG